MAKITLEQINEQIIKFNWQLISTEYKNLNQELHFKCTEGHDVFAPWKKMRNQLNCPVCNQNNFKNIEIAPLPKEKGKYRILALDQASHSTGWSIYDGRELVQYGLFEVSDNDEIKRYAKIRDWLVSMANNWKPDLIGIEGIQFQQNVLVFQVLGRLQGVLLMACHDLGIPCKVCPTNTWRAHCNVKGTSRSDKKTSMQLIVKKSFDITVNDDIADAIGIGKYLAETHKEKRTFQVE